MNAINELFKIYCTQGCKGKGHVCRLCELLPVIFAFEPNATTCKDCHSVYHRNCFNKKDVVCLKCAAHR